MEKTLDSIIAEGHQNIIPLTQAIVRSGNITEQDVLALRRSVFGDGDVLPLEAEALFDLMQKRLPAVESWQQFFIEAMTDYLVQQVEPRGYVSAGNAEWLIDQISRDGVVWTDTELELLVHIIDRATSSPMRLVRFAMDKVKEAVVTGEGPTRRGMELKPGSVCLAEVDMLRRILYAVGTDSGIAVSREEAEALFDINDATLNGDNHPSWQDLFVKAIANHVMALSGYTVPSRAEALRREVWLEDTSVSPGGFFSRMMSGWRDAFSSYREPEYDDRAEERAAAEKISSNEAGWLAERIERNGAICGNEKALLDFIREESPHIHPDLRPLIDRAA